MIADNRIWFGENGNNIPAPKRFLSEVKQGLTPLTIWKYADVGHNQESMRELRDIFDGEKVFDYSKPVKLIKQIVQLYSSENEVILDFFAGSGTTAHAVMDLNATDGGNRKHICVQLPELTDEKSEAYKTGYRTIAEISKERIRRAGKKIQEEIKKEIKNLELLITKLQGELPTEENKTEIENLKSKIEQLKTQDLGFKVLKLEDSNFKQWHQIEGKDAKALAEQMKLFVDPVSESATIENMVYELLLKMRIKGLNCC
jgi:adenine-specific DNA-methyltransferase